MFTASQYRRLALVCALVLSGFAWLGYRLVDLHVFQGPVLRQKAERFTQTRRILEPWRAEIRDRNGLVLASTLSEMTVYANIELCSNRIDRIARFLAPLLRLNENQLARRLRFYANFSIDPERSSPGRAMVLKRHVPLWEWAALTNALARETFGLTVQDKPSAERRLLSRLRQRLVFGVDGQMRVYPYAKSLAHVLGYVQAGLENRFLTGAYGVEGAFQQVLAGRRGECVSGQDANGNELPDQRTRYVPAVDGNPVVLTIDLHVQQIVEQALEEAMRKHSPRSASVIVVRPQTGEILAWGCLPNFSPQEPGASPVDFCRNRPLSDWVEPGSTFKIVTLAAALNESLVNLDGEIFCENGRFSYQGSILRDHGIYGRLTVREAFAKSSNIAHAKIGILLGPDRFYRYITGFGFGQVTGIPLAGETPGRVDAPQKWTPVVLTRLSFGQGIAVSQLQMTMAMSVIANQGRLMRPMIVSRVDSPQGRVLARYQPQCVRSVISPATARQMKEVLKAVVSREGTGALAALENHSVAGKTGTAQKAGPQGYLPDRFYASFIGFFPADDPALCISVALDEPQNGYYGGQVAAPVFRTIAEQIANCLNIPPDKAGTRRAGQRINPQNSQPTQANRFGSPYAVGIGAASSASLFASSPP